MSVTQHQLAKELGISTFAVSHALRGTEQVSAATRRRVLRAAAKLGYRVNTSARATATGRFNAVAFVRSVVESRSWYPEPLIDGIESALEVDGLRLTMTRIDDDRLSSADKLPAVFRELCVDGLLINYISSIPPQVTKLLDSLALPNVWINVDRDHDCVRFDDVGAVQLAVRQLRALGHQRIGYLHYRNPAIEAHYSGALRLSGYTDAMRQAGLRPQILSDERRLPAGEMPDLTARHLASPDRPTALIAYGTPEAGAALLAAARLGLQVPRDLSIACIGDVHALFWASAVAHANLSEAEVGQVAVEVLLNKISNPSEKTPARLVRPVWVAGQTVCPPHPSA